ncbi:MAG: cation diffusion facilitator family transporter [Methylococcaceae bacterium]
MRRQDAVVNPESAQLYKLLCWGLAVEVPIVIMMITSAVLADSAALIAIAAQSGIALVINGFAVYAMLQVMRENAYNFPYGAGKLENFSAFLCGIFYVPSGLFVIFESVERLIHAPEVGYLLGLIPVSITFLSGAVLFIFASRLMRRTHNPSPLLISYRADYLIGMLTDGGVIIAFAIATVLVDLGEPAIGDRIDPAVALAIAFYMLWVGVSLVRQNFRALMDLPLSEDEQIMVTRVLARYYTDYDFLGILCTRSSGTRRFVEIELGFNGKKSMEHVHVLSRNMVEALGEELPGLHFRIVPVWEPED